MDLLKRELVKHKIPYHSYDSSTLAKLLLSNRNDVEFNYKIKDSLFHGYIPSSNRFINIIFLEYGYNFISYFKDDFIYLMTCYIVAYFSIIAGKSEKDDIESRVH